MTQTLILGGPGCGKTTALIGIVEQLFKKGHNPNKIAYLAFTKAAAQEALNRAKEKFGFDEKALLHFRTLHSFAFNNLGLKREDVMQSSDYKDIGELLGYNFKGTDDVFGIPSSSDKLSQLETLSRLKMTSLQNECVQAKNTRYWDLKLFSDTLTNYKKSHHLYDYTDMLTAFVERGNTPELDVVIIDEAQDLCPLQWKVVEKITKNVKKVYIAGDDDQAIYRWAGADVDHFLNLKGNRVILPISYRLNERTFIVLNNILKYIKRRYEKNIKPNNPGGSVEHYISPNLLNITGGSWMLLGRNKYMLNNLEDHIRRLGFPYTYLDKSSINNNNVKAILTWEALRKGENVYCDDIKNVYLKLKKGFVKHGFKKMPGLQDDSLLNMRDLKTSFGLEKTDNWMGALKMIASEREYYREIKKRDESLTKTPRIKISTIHGVKGEEADNVMLLTDMARASYTSFMKDTSDEARVFYVGASRAKKSLHIIHPQTNKFFPLYA